MENKEKNMQDKEKNMQADEIVRNITDSVFNKDTTSKDNTSKDKETADILSAQIEKTAEKVKNQNTKHKNTKYRSNRAAKTKQKKPLKIKIAAISTSALMAIGVGYLISNREPKIDLSTSKVVASVANDKSIDEITQSYNSELVAANSSLVSKEKTIGTALKNETDINKGLDTIEDFIAVSDELAELELDDIISANEGLRDLTPEEKATVSKLSLTDLKAKIEKFKDQSDDIDYNEFSKAAIKYNRLAMDLKYAEEIINTQIANEGNEFLGKYGELLIQSIIIDETGLDIEEYQEIELKGANKDANYNIKYNAEETGQHFVVHTSDSDLKALLDNHTYFESQSDRVDPDKFKKYKKKALEAINIYKKCCLSDYDLAYTGSTNQTWELESTSSNREIRNKVKSLTK